MLVSKAPKLPRILSSQEGFIVGDFWSFFFSNFLAEVTLGVASFIAGVAVGIVIGIRIFRGIIVGVVSAALIGQRLGVALRSGILPGLDFRIATSEEMDASRDLVKASTDGWAVDVGVKEISERGRGEVGRGAEGSPEPGRGAGGPLQGDSSRNMILISRFQDESVRRKGLAAGPGERILTPDCAVFFSGVFRFSDAFSASFEVEGGENTRFRMCGDLGDLMT